MICRSEIEWVRDLRIIFFENEPFFVSSKIAAKKAEINFVYHFALVIEEGNPGWRVVSQGLKFPVAPFYYQYIHPMVEKINASIEAKSGFLVGDYLLAYKHENWRDSYFSYRLIQVVDGDISPFPPDPNCNRLFLTYRNGRPIFFQKQKIGTKFAVNFGECFWIHNYLVAEVVSFEVALRKEGETWKLSLTGIHDNCHYDLYKNPWEKNLVFFIS